MVTFNDVAKSEEIRAYIKAGDKVLETIGYTEHSLHHAGLVSQKSGMILKRLGYSQREQELAQIAGLLHDIGNVVNRIDHAQTGAVMAFRLLDKLGMNPEELAIIIGAIGNHDEGTGQAISCVSAALILADKSDVRRTRVRNAELIKFDIHDRVNYAVEKSNLRFEEKEKIVLELAVDTSISPVLDYFEIFLSRMLMCRKACEFLEVDFGLEINKVKLL